MGAAWADQVTGTDIGHNFAECSNRGTCNPDTGVCACDSGFTGTACERMSCNCNGHGRCTSMQGYAMTKDPGLGEAFSYANNWDAAKIYGCVCDPGYSGPSCTERICPSGDDPLTGTIQDPAGIQRNEKQRVTCKATGGSFTLIFRGWTTEPILASDSASTVRAKLIALPTINAATVAFGGITIVACTAIGNDISIEFTQDFGNLPDLRGDGTNLVHNPPTAPTLAFMTVVQGTKENLVCSRRGLCDRTSGICGCYSNYFSSNGIGMIGQRGDCGFVRTTVTSCPGEIACSGQGTCRGPSTYDCICNEGFTGGDCNERECPKGKAWFDLPIADDVAHQLVECSNAGVCDRLKGDCVCNSGFTGAACNRMTCPNDCSGHGTCYTMEELAKRAQLNGEQMGWTYGAVPNKKETWDYDMVRGCLCAAGWEGYDCSKQTCPTGDDPMTVYNPNGSPQENEVQVLTCTGNSGFFSLKFRDAVTPQLPFSVSASSLQIALSALTAIGDVTVTYSNGAVACTSAGTNTIRVEFLNDFGDLPPLRWILDGALVMTINEDGAGSSRRGTKENAVCSNRGVCNTVGGTCRCAFGFTSSDGNGKEGDRGDCGYKDLIYLNSAGKVANEI
uniref:EGF-like domain-containing protein n=1 Tax=Globisporangium ultimum (strain ATCC 200006 / CBS 805.95 / DAOM BR144) TaxID=431595 RepID=K3X6W1_GLOUD